MADEVAGEAVDEPTDGVTNGIRGASDSAAKVATTSLREVEGSCHIAPTVDKCALRRREASKAHLVSHVRIRRDALAGYPSRSG
jgi:hypothetical protein